MCDICHRGVELNKKKVEASLKKNPIPFRRRYGWTFLVGLIAIFVAWASYDSQNREANDHVLINAPRVNDLYLTDISKILKNPEHSPMYGILRVKATAGNQIELTVSKVSYSKSSGPTKDINDGKALSNDYYYAETILIPVRNVRSPSC